MALLGDDGNGFELARELERHGLWRRWLGESLHSNFTHCLSSSLAWDSFMSAEGSKSRAQIQLQLRVRALLFDKAAFAPFPRKPQSHSVPSHVSSPPISKLNPNYLQLHGDDVYFTLEDVPQQRDCSASDSAPSEVQSRADFGSRYSESEVDSTSQRFVRDDFPENWYSQFIEKYRATRPYVLSSFNRDSEKRTPSAMANYLRHRERHKRRRIAFKEDAPSGSDCSLADNSSNKQLGCGADGDSSGDDSFHPETMFVMNCVPDSAIPPTFAVEQKPKVEFFGVLDKLPQVATKNSIMIERLGISMDQGPGKTRSRVGLEGNKKWLTQEQAMVLSKKATGYSLMAVGFESSSEVPIDILSQFLGCHISKLGKMLRVLADSYRKKYSATELLRMFLRVLGHSNVGALTEYIKDGKSSSQQGPRPVHSLQAQLQLPHQNPLHLPQQIQRQMLPQMQQMIHPQQFTQQQQQQWARMRRAQAQAQAQAQAPTQAQTQVQAQSQAQALAQAQLLAQTQAHSPRPSVSVEKDNRPMVEVKIENTDISVDNNNAFNAMNNRQTQFHIRQQQMAAMQRLAQNSAQYRQQFTPFQIAQMQQQQQSAQNVGGSRAPPVKVEGFQELMGGDSSLKHDPIENKLTSPSK